MGCSSSTSAQNVTYLLNFLNTLLIARVCLIQHVNVQCSKFNRYSGSGKEDQAFAKERDTRRTQFDKKTGKAVTVTGPKDKPESVCI